MTNVVVEGINEVSVEADIRGKPATVPVLGSDNLVYGWHRLRDVNYSQSPLHCHGNQPVVVARLANHKRRHVTPRERVFADDEVIDTKSTVTWYGGRVQGGSELLASCSILEMLDVLSRCQS